MSVLAVTVARAQEAAPAAQKSARSRTCVQQRPGRSIKRSVAERLAGTGFAEIRSFHIVPHHRTEHFAIERLAVLREEHRKVVRLAYQFQAGLAQIFSIQASARSPIGAYDLFYSCPGGSAWCCAAGE